MAARLLLLLWVVLCGSAHAISLQLREVATGVADPVAITHAGDERLFIVEQDGRIRILKDGVLLAQPFLDIDPLVRSGAERGLLGLAFHPDYGSPGAAGEGLFWVNYTDNDGDTVIARYSGSPANPDRAEPTSAVVLLEIDQPFGNHNGGQLQFGPPEGPDGRHFLYIGMGDGGSGGDPQNHAQRDDSVLGKMLRIDPSTAAAPLPPAYSIPAGNPNPEAGLVLGTIWAKGLRNPWRFSFDRETGDLYIGDVGQNRREEIDVTRAGTPGGLNYGWRIMEGFACFNPPSDCPTAGLEPPAFDYAHEAGRCSVIGGYVYRGAHHPNLDGLYLYGDFCSGEVFGLRETSPGSWQNTRLLDAPFRILTFGEDAAGELYVGGTDDRIYRIADLDVPLAAGLNLYVRPVAPESAIGCETVAADTGGEVSRLDAAAQRFEPCAGGAFAIEPGRGYLLEMNDAERFLLEGQAECPDIDALAGLNLIGVPAPPPGLGCFDLIAALGGSTFAATLQRIDPATGAFEACATPEGGTGNPPAGTDFPIRPGEGYLLSARSARSGVQMGDPAICGEE